MDLDHVAVDETVIQLNYQQYWLYAAADPNTNELLHTTLESTRNTLVTRRFSLRLARNTPFLRLCFLLMDHHRYKLRAADNIEF